MGSVVDNEICASRVRRIYSSRAQLSAWSSSICWIRLQVACNFCKQLAMV